MAARRARSIPALVSPIFMLDTSMAITGVWDGRGFRCIVWSLSVDCPWNMGVTSSVAASVSSVRVSYGWYSEASAPVLWMFLMLLRLSSINLVGRVGSSRLGGGKLYLVVVCVYCAC